MTIQNGKLKAAVKKRRRTLEKNQALNTNNGNNMGSTTDESVIVSARQPRQSKSNKTKLGNQKSLRSRSKHATSNERERDED